VASAATPRGAGAADGPQHAHAAKAFVAEQGVELAHNCFQVFGGIGYTWEHDQHFWFRRLNTDAIAFGDAAWHRSQLLDVVEVAR
jgi:alkylation response protein AidB-like acyl-CoA dehydrogenase